MLAELLTLLGLVLVTCTLALSASADWNVPTPCFNDQLEHGGGLNVCGCDFNRKTGECHCHRSHGCGCACQPATCK